MMNAKVDGSTAPATAAMPRVNLGTAAPSARRASARLGEAIWAHRRLAAASVMAVVGFALTGGLLARRLRRRSFFEQVMDRF